MRVTQQPQNEAKPPGEQRLGVLEPARPSTGGRAQECPLTLRTKLGFQEAVSTARVSLPRHPHPSREPDSSRLPRTALVLKQQAPCPGDPPVLGKPGQLITFCSSRSQVFRRCPSPLESRGEDGWRVQGLVWNVGENAQGSILVLFPARNWHSPDAESQSDLAFEVPQASVPHHHHRHHRGTSLRAGRPLASQGSRIPPPGPTRWRYAQHQPRPLPGGQRDLRSCQPPFSPRPGSSGAICGSRHSNPPTAHTSFLLTRHI